MTIAVAGCVAQAEGAEIMTRQPAVDLVVGPQAYHRLPELIARAHRASGERLATDFEANAKFDALPDERRSGLTAFLTVQEGCDKFCSFCVVPYTRGAEYSRPPEAILAEAERLAANGVREVTLLGQNVNAYAGGLAPLIRRLARIGGLDRIRYTTSHPSDMDDELIAAHGEVEALMPYLHLPAQAGSDRVLKAMNRGYSAGGYLRLVERVRAARPDIALSGDFIVGFPGETAADFEATLALVRRPTTPAPFRSSTPAGPARRAPPCRARSPRRRRTSDFVACRPCSPSNRPASMALALAGPWACSSSGPVATRASWSDVVPIYRPCTPPRRRPRLARSCRS